MYKKCYRFQLFVSFEDKDVYIRDISCVRNIHVLCILGFFYLVVMPSEQTYFHQSFCMTIIYQHTESVLIVKVRGN